MERVREDIQLAPDEFQPALDRAVGLELLLLEQHRAHELVDDLVVLQVIELLPSC